MSDQLDRILGHLEAFFPKTLTSEDWQKTFAFRWLHRQSVLGSIGFLKPIKHLSDISFDDLQSIERQKELILTNTKHFVEGRPANNVLLTGARGTGKSSLIKACLNRFCCRRSSTGRGR